MIRCSSITIYLTLFISFGIINTASSSNLSEKESSMIDNNFCAYATRRKLCEKNRSNTYCVWKQKRGGNVDEEGMCIDKRVEEFFESMKRCRYNVKKLFKAYDMGMVVVSRLSVCVHIISLFSLHIYLSYSIISFERWYQFRRIGCCSFIQCTTIL